MNKEMFLNELKSFEGITIRVDDVINHYIKRQNVSESIKIIPNEEFINMCLFFKEYGTILDELREDARPIRKHENFRLLQKILILYNIYQKGELINYAETITN